MSGGATAIRTVPLRSRPKWDVMRQVVLRTGEFTTEHEAMTLAEAAGLVPLAFDCDPAMLTMPIDKAPADRPA